MAIMAKKERAFGEKCWSRGIHSPHTHTHLPSALHSSILYIYLSNFIFYHIYIYIYIYKIIKFDKERPHFASTHTRARVHNFCINILPCRTFNAEVAKPMPENSRVQHPGC